MRKWVCGLLSIAGIAMIITGALSVGNKAVAVIGGADGPTSIFIAVKPNSSIVTTMLVCGIIIILGIIIIVVKKRK